MLSTVVVSVIIVLTVLIIIISVLWHCACLAKGRASKTVLKNCCNNAFYLGHTIDPGVTLKVDQWWNQSNKEDNIVIVIT